MGAQKPLRRAYERNDAAITRWLNEYCPTVVKKAKQEKSVTGSSSETVSTISTSMSLGVTVGLGYLQSNWARAHLNEFAVDCEDADEWWKGHEGELPGHIQAAIAKAEAWAAPFPKESIIPPRSNRGQLRAA